MSNENGIELTEKELSQSKASTIANKHLISSFQDYNFHAIYQRQIDAWTLEMKQKLLKSIICDIPCGTVHIVAHKTKIDFWLICDGIQRWSVIKEFVNGDTKLSFVYDDKKLTYQDLKKPENQKLLSKFQNYLWDLRQWPPMKVIKQRDLFETINAMASLTDDERLYCSNFFTKSLLFYVYKLMIDNIGDKFSLPICTNKRLIGLKWCHDLLFQCFGHDFKGTVYNAIPSSKKRKHSARDVNEIFRPYFQDEIETSNACLVLNQDESDENIIDDSVLKQTRLKDNIDLLMKTFLIIKDVFSYGNTIKNKLDQNAMKNVIIWTLNHIRSKSLTTSQIRDDRSKFFSIFKAFFETRKEKGFTQKQTAKSTQIKTFEYLDKLCIARGINLDEKSKPLTEEDKNRAMSRSNGKCPFCEAILTNETVHFDHILCKSKHSKTDAACLCNICNLQKSNWTSEQLMKYATIIEKLDTKENIPL